MPVSLSFKKTISRTVPHVMVPVFEGGILGHSAKALDKQNGGLIAHALTLNTTFKGKLGEVLELYPPANGGLSRIILVGFGSPKKLDGLKMETAGGKVYAAISGAGMEDVAFIAHDEFERESLKTPVLLAHFANGFSLRSYTFDRYKTLSKKAKDKPARLKTLEMITEKFAPAKAAFESLHHVTQGVCLARDLVNTPPNDLYPESFAKIIVAELKSLGVEIEVLDEKKMLKMGMGAIMAVGQGSVRQPRMVIMRWNGLGGNKAKNLPAPVAFVGKGVTFDTGGISLKPGAGMDEMKMDMGGSAAVVGLMKALALRGAKAHVVGIVGLAENMPSGNAYRPADILTSYSGKTIEVLNTDAEGRLVLADCLSYVQKTYKPRAVIDLATLTGAILVALGHEYCGTFSNDESLWKSLESASIKTGEKLWRMPLDEAWKKEVESDIADIQNIAKSGRNAGSCTAAGFLNHFIEEGTPWAHLDIAGTAWRKTDLPTVPKCGSGFGVRLLDSLVADQYES